MNYSHKIYKMTGFFNSGCNHLFDYITRKCNYIMTGFFNLIRKYNTKHKDNE